MNRKTLILILAVAALCVVVAMLAVPALAGPDDSAFPSPEPSASVSPAPAPGQTPPGQSPPDQTPPGQTSRPDGSDAPSPTSSSAPPPFPDWFNQLTDMPAWLFTVDEFPAWFYELPSEPDWFRQAARIPSWFYQITEIPAWFYPPEPCPCGMESCECAGGPEDCDCADPLWPGPEPLICPCGIPNCLCEGDPDCECAGPRPDPDCPCGMPDCLCEGEPDCECDPYTPIPPGFCPCGILGCDCEGGPDCDCAEGGFILPDPDPIDNPELPVSLPHTVPIPGGVGEIRSSVPHDLVTNTAVSVEFPSHLYITRDGELFSWTPGDVLADPGFYEIGSPDVAPAPLFRFRIVRGPVNDLPEYTAPNGFFIREVSYNETLFVVHSISYPLEEDGAYFLILQEGSPENFVEVPEDVDPESGWVPPEMIYVSVEIDRTPPVLTFEGLDDEDTAYGPVSWSADEPNVSIRVVRNNKHYDYNLWELSETGQYLIIASDAAGNESLYALTLRYDMNAAAIWTIVIAALLLSSLAGYLIYYRRHLRVR
ncbi:MAG: hypothetical protein FWG93_00055 [Oscillospiraceae bacterium]|nr:hypothetical protein [Oscillospiraceae bacterium]